MKTKKPKAKRDPFPKIDGETFYFAVAYPKNGEPGGPVAWSCGYSEAEVKDTMSQSHWPRRHYRIARCRLVEMPKRKARKG